MIDKDTIIKLAREAGMQCEFHCDGVNKPQLMIAGGTPATTVAVRFAQSIYRQGLKDAADRAIDIVALHGGSVETEAHIRQELKGEE